MQREEGQLPPGHAGRSMDWIWYGSRGRVLVMLPTSGGRQNENEDFGLTGALAPLIDAGELQVVCVDSLNRESWGKDELSPEEKLRVHGGYDRFLVHEFFPFVAAKSGRHDPALYGASLGGWQAVTFAARYPHLVKRVIAFSGFFDLRRVTKSWFSGEAYFFSPLDFISNMDPAWVARLSQVEWIIATGETDSLVEETRNLAGVFRQKGIPHHAEIWPGVFGHDWPFWKQHLPRFLP